MQIVRNEPEEWRPVVGYEGLYEVSNLGRAKSLDRITKCGEAIQNRAGKVLRPGVSSHGYPGVALCANGKPKTQWVHRLVALAFIPNPENKPDVNHMDGNKSNSQATNLEWVTTSENIIHSYRVLGQRAANTRAVVQLSLSGAFISNHASIADAARSIGGTKNNLSQCLNGRNKSAHGFAWRFQELKSKQAA